MIPEIINTECLDIYSGRRCKLSAGRILRQVAGCRIVYDGYCGTEEAIIKVFLSRLHGKRHWSREKRGLEGLVSRGLRTAAILTGGQTTEGYYALAIAKISHAEDLFTLKETTTVNLEEAFYKLTVYLAGMHEAGVCQHDLHLGNFLWDGQEIYGLDPAQMAFSNQPIGRTKSIRQLVCLLTNFNDACQREKLTRLYYQTRRWTWSGADYRRIELQTNRYLLKTIENGLKKTLRTSKRFIRVKDHDSTGVFDRTLFAGQDVRLFMQGLDTLMESGEILKRGNTCFVSKVEVNGQQVVIKRYNHKGLLHSLRHTIKGSRAKKCWLFGHRLAWLGIASAKPLAFVEQRKLGMVWQSWIITEYVPSQPLNDVCGSLKPSDPKKKAILTKTEKLLQTLIHYHLTHNDLKPNNILVCENEPVLIDLDSMHLHRFRFLLKYRSEKMLTYFRCRLELSIST